MIKKRRKVFLRFFCACTGKKAISIGEFIPMAVACAGDII
ncbi:hypothetical protein HMPREF9166_0665 [Selenomonas sp. oral taxon 149 str. 67H29BP]|nr:hypothetical protein HMPREF9166_0665 [Selenomonas sp. oral taxon 149 str. 67H29BP]